MEDLRILAIEQEFVVLEGASGEKFRLALDDNLRKAIRNEKGPRVESDSLSPREIQELVRSGATVDEIVAKTGAAFAFVEKFAVPVLEELEHVVSSAQSVRLNFIGERYGESNHIEFGVLIRDRLEQLGAKDTQWSARRNETGGWQVSCAFELDGELTSAKWSFDLRHLSLSPENEVALNLAASPKPDSLLPKVKSVGAVGETAAAQTPTAAISIVPPVAPSAAPVETNSDSPLVGKNLTMSLGDTQEFADVIPFGRGRNTTAQVPVIAAGTSAEIDDEPVEEINEDEDLLDGLRRRRDEREAKTAFSPILEVVKTDDSDFDDTTVWIESGDEVFVDEEDISQDAETNEPEVQPDAETPASKPTTNPAANPPRRGRASMPSWDEIVFGTKADSADD